MEYTDKQFDLDLSNLRTKPSQTGDRSSRRLTGLSAV
jgi:hypothetical protein